MSTKRNGFLCILLLFSTIAKSEMTMPPPSVDVVSVQLSTLKPTIEAVGTFKAEHGITVRAEITGKVTAVFFKSGDMVKQDDKLIQLNQAILEAQLKSYQSDLQLSQLDFDRTNKLHQKNLMSKADFDKAVAKVNSDQAHVDEAKAKLEQTIIKAPFAGKVGLVQINVGDYLSPGDKITDLEDNDPIFVDFNLPETYLSQIKIGQDVLVHSDVVPHKSFRGKVIATDVIANQETRSVIMRASIPNPNWELVPGTFATLTIYLPEKKDVLKLPHAAINYSASGNFVYRVNNDKVEKVSVKLGYSDESNVVVEDQLKVGDKIIVNGIDKVQPGMPVKINKVF